MFVMRVRMGGVGEKNQKKDGKEKGKREVSSTRSRDVVSTILTLDIVADLDFSSSSPFRTFKKHLGGVPVLVLGQGRVLGIGILGLGVRRVGRVVEGSAACVSSGVVQSVAKRHGETKAEAN